MEKFITVMGQPNELGYDMTSVIAGDPMADVIVGYDDELGVSFFKKIGKGISKVGKAVTKPLGSVIKLANSVTKVPGIGIVFAATGPAGAGALAGVKIANMIAKGSPKQKAAALKLVQNTRKAAAKGNPAAIKGLAVLRKVAAARRKVQSRVSGSEYMSAIGGRSRGGPRRGFPVMVQHTLPGRAGLTGKLCLPNGRCVDGTFVKVR